jgi:hypothetical protein
MQQRVCFYCGNVLDKKWQNKFCSNQCQADARFKDFKDKWLKGHKVTTVNVSRYIKRFLLEKFGEKCQECGWNKKHPVTKRVPLEVEHVDADAGNNSPENLKLLCPNCHALTPTFRNLNKGNGRAWRKRYI